MNTFDQPPGPRPMRAEYRAALRQELEVVVAVQTKRRRWLRSQFDSSTHRAVVIAVAAAIVVVFFVPLPHVSLFHSLVAPAKVTPTKTPMVTSVRVTPTEVTGAGGYLWMLGTYPCSTGTCSVVMRSSDGGKSFVRFGTLPAADYRIEFANREDGYAFGSGGGPDAESRLYWTGDGGKTWRFALARFRYSSPLMVVITDGRAYVLVGTNCSPGLCKSVQLASSPVTSDTWTARPLPLTAGEVENQFGWAVFGSNVWVIMTSGSNTHLLISHNRGRTFSKLTPGGRAFSKLTAGGLGGLGCNLTATSPTTLWGFCASGNGGDAIRSTDGGRSFVSVRTPGGNYLLTPGGMSNYFLIYPTSDSEAIFYPDFGDLWLTRDGGKRFSSLLRIPHSSEYNCDVALASARTWLVLGLSLYKPNTSYLMWRTTTAGRSWEPVKAPSVTTATGGEGKVTGTFVAVGGASPGLPRSLPGQVTAANTAGHKFTVTVGKSGKFVLWLPAGLYRLTGHSPMFSVNGAEGTSAADQPVRVRAGKKTLGVEVVCLLF